LLNNIKEINTYINKLINKILFYKKDYLNGNPLEKAIIVDKYWKFDNKNKYVQILVEFYFYTINKIII